jgi:hypothetical protein
MRAGALLAVASGALLLAACVRPTVVERAYGGNVVQGRYVAPEAYAWFLRGSLAAAAHRTEDAVAAYQRAASLDPASPEPWTRIADVLCDAGEREGRARAAIEHALTLDSDDRGAWAARARCAAVRGDAREQHDAATRASALGDSTPLVVTHARPGEDGRADRQELVALTLAAPEPVVAWASLVAWAEAHGDVALWTRGLLELGRIAPERRGEVAQAAEAMVGAGLGAEARTVAAAVVDAAERPVSASMALAVRLAVDEAIERGDREGLIRRASRGRVPLEEAAARALLAGRAGMARDIAAEVQSADAGSLGARIVAAAAAHGDVAAAAAARPGDAPASAAAWVVLGQELATASAPSVAATTLASTPHDPLLAHDPRVTRVAVGLAVRGVLDPAALPPDGLVELAVIEGRAPASPDAAALDLRHRYLALAASRPTADETRTLGIRLHAIAPADPLVLAGDALLQLASSSPVDPGAPRALLAHDPGDPLLAALALRLAERSGDTEVARRAREMLTAMGATRRSLQ